jgi:GAF domain-containing protein
MLASHRNLPDAWAIKLGQPLDDGVSSFVALSGETFAINGEPLKRFKAASLGKSMVVVPIKVQQEVIGLLVVVRKADMVFEHNTQTLLEAVADYASVSLVNARLFRALKASTDAAQAGGKLKLELLQALKQELQSLIQPVTYSIDLLLTGKMGSLTDEQRQVLKSTQLALQRNLQLVMAERLSQPRAKLNNR